MPAEKEERVRLTISVTPEVHDTFQRLAQSSGQSISRAMGDWLSDTLDAAAYSASMMEKARAAPKIVMREVHAYALGLADETGKVLDDLRAGRALAPSELPAVLSDALRPAGPEAAKRVHSPPSSNTGGKVPRKVGRRTGS